MANAIIQQPAPVPGAIGTPDQPAAITPFAFDSLALRSLSDESGNPWFIARDVCSCLGISNTAQAVDRLSQNEKGICFTYTLGGTQELATVNEPGLYRLIFRSNKPEARAFQDWVYHEVLPAIRKTGAYGVEAERIFSLEQRLERLEGQSRKTRQARREEFPGLHENFPDIRRLTNYRCQILRLADADQGASTGEI
ncbi:MAG: hypothetical protein GY862_13355, partial [Gammaproteobacteria bacterium]|nr:hypothetical protein [Gammaproteobacteria bacterium]